MSDADQEIQAAARALADELAPHEVTVELAGGELPEELLAAHRRRVAELGFEAINMPRELGGGGFSAFQQVLVQEQIGRVTNALGWVVHTPASWLPKVATAEQLERWVVPTTRGERRECYAITEEGAGSDVDAIAATATRDGDGYRLNGVKWHVTSFNHADHVFFQGKLIEEATAFARKRQAYGRPIFDYQAIQFMLADSLTELWAARLMTYQTANGLDADLDVKVQHAQCSMAKLYASEMAGRVADRAVQVFGGRGYMHENVAERFYRELRVDRIWEGTSEIQRAIIADQLAKRGVARLTG
jgi:alkylation response protein AidB-like acyl-CoA dehydrogenase